MNIVDIETILRGMQGLEFQYCCERYLSLKHAKDDFRRVNPNGRDGDGGKDGYCKVTKEYFAISSNQKVNKKLEYDLRNCLFKNDDVQKFTFITNRGMTVRDWPIIDALQKENPQIRIKVLTYADLAKDIAKMSKINIEIVLNRDIVSLEEEDAIYFEEDKSKQESFSIKQSFTDSMFYYKVIMISSVVLLIISFVFSTTLLLSIIAMMIYSCLVFVFIDRNRDRIMKTKFPLRILFLIISGKLKINKEVLFDSKSFFSIYRDSLWNFTFRRRVAKCMKKGCCGKVYLYVDKDYTMIGKCENDKVNHIYKVDNNFYGELIPFKYL